MPLSMCNWRVSVDDTRGCHWTPSQTEPASTPEAIGDQQSSGGPSEKYQCIGAVCISVRRHSAKHLEASLKTFDLDVVAARPRSAVQFQIKDPVRTVPSQHESVAVLGVSQGP